MTQAFDSYRDSYEATVGQSIAYSGLSHDFFLAAKADLLADLFAAHFGAEYRPAVLDVGCGVGRMHPLLAPLAGTLAGTDPSGAEIDRAHRDNPGVDYRVGDGIRLPWQDDSFDVALAVCVVHHVPASDWGSFVAEMRRVVRADGLVVLIEHNRWNPLTRLSVLRCEFDRDAVLLPAGRARGLLADAGCRRVETRHFLLLPSRHRVARGVERAVRRLPLGAQYAAVGRA